MALIKTGFEPEYSIIFDGAVSNHMEMEKDANGDYTKEKWIPTGSHALLNGASDNALSSCMGCHAADFGPTSQAIQKHLKQDPKRGDFTWQFTFYNSKDFKFIENIMKETYGPAFDFNLQLESSSKRVNRYLCELNNNSQANCKSN